MRNNVIEASDVSFGYGDGPVIDSIDVSVTDGECVLLCGPSGCGKTTLAKCLCGIVPNLNRQGEMDGEVRLHGTASTALSKTELAERVGAVFDDPETQIIGLSVEEDVAFGCENLGVDEETTRRRVERTLDLLDLSEYRDRDPRHLSGGEKQRLAIASAIAKDPDVLLLDEPLSQLDPSGSDTALGMIRRQKERGKTILLLARKLGPEIRLADRVVALEGGETVVDTTPEQFLDDARLVEDLGMWFPEGETGRRRTTADGEARTGPVLEVEDLWYSYVSDAGRGGDAEWALRDVSLRIPGDRVVALVGHNGSGKTTLSKHLNGLYSPNHGTVRFRGDDVTGRNSTAVAGDVGYVFQNPDTQIFTTTVRKEVRYGPENLGYDDVEDRVRRALRQVDLGDRVDERTSKLSRGEKQRVAIASVLAVDPDVLILDEPSGGIDYGTFWGIMAELTGEFLTPDRSIVLISHDARVVRRWADEVVELADGQVVRGVDESDPPEDDHWRGDPTPPVDLAGSAARPSTEADR
jgi:energy-coupling factor transport system ATP-binding protein